MKPIIPKLWMVIAMLWLSISASAYDFEVDGIQYTVISISDRTCSVEEITAEAGEIVSIPEKIAYNNDLFTISKFESGCASSSILKELNIEDCVITELSGSFSGAQKLESVRLPLSLTTIGDYTFNYCTSLTSINIPNGVTTIGDRAFFSCYKLVECSLPSTLQIIGAMVFENCEALASISIPPYVESIGNHCFESCKSLNDLVFEGKTDSPPIEIPQLSNSSFWNIGAFTDCNPSFIEINRTIEYKPYTAGSASFAFEKAPHTLKIGMIPSNIPYGLFGSGMPTDLIISDRPNVLELPQSYDVDYLYLGGNVNQTIKSNNAEISDYVTELPSSFFAGSGFKHIILPTSIENIGFACFSHCYNLEDIEIPSSVKIIPASAFSNCSSLKKIVLKEGLETIETNAFKDVDLDIIECNSMTPASVAEAAFTNKTYLNANLIVKEEAIEIYKNAENWRNFFNIKYFTPVTGLTIEPANALLEVGTTTTLNVEYTIDNPNGYPLIDFVLGWTSNDKEVAQVSDRGVLQAINPGETIIRAYSLENNSIVGECAVKVVPEIPEFFVVSGIRYHKLDNLNVQIASYDYSGDIIIPASIIYNDMTFSVTGIEYDAFNNCSELMSIQIPSGVQSLPNSLFSGAMNLKKVIIDGGNNPLIVGCNLDLHLSSTITPFPNPSDVDEKRTGFRNGYYDGLFYGLPIEHLVINRDIELPKYYERTMGNSTSSYSTVYNDIVYYPPFYGLTNLKYLEIGENVSAICKNQIEAVVDAVPTTIEYTNFGKCDNIEVVVSNNPNAPIGGGFSQTVYERAPLFLPNGGLESYKSDDYWKNFAQMNETSFIPIESITFESDEVIIGINESKMLSPIINPSNASIRTLNWSSSNASIIEVSEDGVVTSSSQEGEAVITATACDGTGVTNSIKVIVPEGAGVSDMYSDSNIDISVAEGKLYIRGKADTDTVLVYNVQGQLIISTNDSSINIGSKGIYIVKIDSVSKKVII